MDEPRFYAQDLQPGFLTLGPAESRHACQALRLTVGDAVQLFDGNGGVAHGELVEITKRVCAVQVARVERQPRPVGPELTLITALPRSSRQQFLFEKCTELGVRRIVPCLFERSTVKPQASSMAKWRQWTIEAGKQSGAAYLPQIDDPSTFAASLALSDGAGLKAYGATSGGAPRLTTLLTPPPPAATLWIGPEGGMTEDDLEALQGIGAQPVSLGALVLRVETACVAAAAVVSG